MLNAYTISCIIEKPHNFTDGRGVVVYKTILMVHAKDEERVRQLIEGWEADGVRVDIKEISKDGLTEEAEAVMKVYDEIIETKPTDK